MEKKPIRLQYISVAISQYFDPRCDHNHPYLKDKDVDLIVLREGIKGYGINHPDDKPFHIITNCVETSGVDVDASDFNNLRKFLYRYRRKLLGRPPKTKMDAIETLKQLTIMMTNLCSP